MAAKLRQLGVETDAVRAVDHQILPGVSSDEEAGHEWSHSTGEAASANLHAAARALAANPIPAPPS